MWNYLQNSQKPIVLYGMGNGADKVLAECDARGIRVAGIFASDGFARHNQFHGYTVISYSEMKQRFDEMIVLVCFGSARPEVIANVQRIAAEQETYFPDFPVFGEGLFDESYYSNRSGEFQNLRSLLADLTSVHTLDCLLQYRLTWKYDYLSNCECQPQDIWRDILRPGSNEHFLDLGAYRGDTVKQFLQQVSNYTAITALEPDDANYRKLEESTASLPRCRSVHAAAWDITCEIPFAVKNSRNSSASVNGTPVPAIRCDELCPADSPFTLIDIDVEGAELAAIQGLRNTIAAHKPKLSIAAYHRLDDYLAIPTQVLSIRNDYRVYMRHFPGFPAWDTYFYFI